MKIILYTTIFKVIVFASRYIDSKLFTIRNKQCKNRVDVFQPHFLTEKSNHNLQSAISRWHVDCSAV
jgi:hypothetical protein